MPKGKHILNGLLNKICLTSLFFSLIYGHVLIVPAYPSFDLAAPNPLPHKNSDEYKQYQQQEAQTATGSSSWWPFR
jgi:hypothetical protein